MSEMVDRVARAQWELARKHGRVSQPWDELSEELRGGGRELAKVAMKEISIIFSGSRSSAYDLAAEWLEDESK